MSPPPTHRKPPTDVHTDAHSSWTEATVRRQRNIQDQQDAHDAEAKATESSAAGPPRTDNRARPGPPLPRQHLEKPGNEHELSPQPQFLAPSYRGSGKLQGMNALITGGDSGIGRAVAILFAREGANVALAYLNEHEDAQETQRYIEQEGARCMLIPGDITHPDFCTTATKRVVDTFGHLDILVNNAAFQEHASSLLDITDERLDTTFRTNIYAYIRMARAALPYLPAGGSIINTGSVTGLHGHGSLLDYAATKGAIHAFTMSLAASVIERGIRVNAVVPGPVWTPLNPADQPAEDIESFGSGTAMRRPAQPEEIAPAYVFLAAPSCSSYITGMMLPITGSPGK